jgi:outer membrane protein TolC
MIMLALLCATGFGPARAQETGGAEDLPPLAQAVLDSAIAVELANLPGAPLTLEEAQALAREGATTVRLARAGVDAARGTVRRESGSYDPEFYGDVEYLSEDIPSASVFAGAPVLKNDTARGEAGLRWRAPLGTELTASLNAVRLETNSTFAQLMPEYDTWGELSVTQPLLDGFGAGQRGDLTVAERQLEAAQARLDDARVATSAEVEASYWELYAAGRDFTVQRIITQRAQSLMEQAQTRARIGVSGPSDVANARVFLAEQQQALLDARERLGETSDQLASLIGARPADGSELFLPVDEPPSDFPVRPVEELIDAAEAQNHGLHGLERDVAASNAAYEQASRNALPDLDLFGGVGGNGLTGTGQETVIFGTTVPAPDVDGNLGDGLSQVLKRDYPNWRVGVSFSVPIGNRGDGGERDRLAAEVVRAEQRLEEARRTLEAQVRAAHRALGNGNERLEAARFGVDAAREQVRIGVLEYESGRTSAFELVRLGGDLAAAQQRYSRALVRTARAAAVLRQLTGGAYPDEEIQP